MEPRKPDIQVGITQLQGQSWGIIRAQRERSEEVVQGAWWMEAMILVPDSCRHCNLVQPHYPRKKNGKVIHPLLRAPGRNHWDCKAHARTWIYYKETLVVIITNAFCQYYQRPGNFEQSNPFGFPCLLPVLVRCLHGRFVWAIIDIMLVNVLCKLKWHNATLKNQWSMRI